MPAFTTRLGLYKPGGGSTGTILPDETADIDKLNQDFDKIDAAVGAFICTSVTRPATPYDGQIIFETDTGTIRIWRQSTTTWEIVNGIPVVSDLAALAAISPSVFEGRTIHVDLLGANFQSQDTVWVQISPAVFPDSATRNTEYAKAGGVYRVTNALVRRTDRGNRLERYVGPNPNSWVMEDGSLYPTAAALNTAGAGTVNAPNSDGIITFTTATGVLVTFDPDELIAYRHMVAEFEMISASATPLINLNTANAGAAIVAGYSGIRREDNTAGATSATKTVWAATAATFGSALGSAYKLPIHIYDLGVAANKVIRQEAAFSAATANRTLVEATGVMGDANVRTQIVFTPSTGTFNGQLAFKGFRF